MTLIPRLNPFWTAALALTLAATNVLAHDDKTLNMAQSANGGQMRMAGIYHFELVLDKVAKEAKDKPVLVYVTDHAGQKIPTAGATGSVTILSNKLKTSVTLQPDGDNRLKGSGSYASTPDLKAVLSLTIKGAQPEQARFTPLALAEAALAEHKH